MSVSRLVALALSVCQRSWRRWICTCTAHHTTAAWSGGTLPVTPPVSSSLHSCEHQAGLGHTARHQHLLPAAGPLQWCHLCQNRGHGPLHWLLHQFVGVAQPGGADSGHADCPGPADHHWQEREAGGGNVEAVRVEFHHQAGESRLAAERELLPFPLEAEWRLPYLHRLLELISSYHLFY